MIKTAIHLLCMLLALTLAFSCAILGTAEDKKVVRVGWYESAFHRTDPFGRRSGYGYEYQQRVATFTGWEYEYVEGSWSELFEMLEAGTIDLLSDVSFTEARAEKILYSALGMGSEDYHAFISPSNTEIRPDDFSTFNGKRVGVNKNSIQEQLFIEWTKNRGVQPQIVELTGKSPELIAMLDRGEIDILVTLDAYGNTAQMVPVCKVGASDFFFGINKNRPDLKNDLDAAMNRILEDNRYFNQQLAEKYENSQSITGFLTADEMNWLAGHGAIRVGYRDNFLPLCDLDDETQAHTGALADFLTFAETCEKNAELSFESRAYATMEAGLQALANGEIDCMFPVNLSVYDGEQRGVIITDTLVRTEMYAAVRTGDRRGVSPDREMTVAVMEENPNYETFLMDYFPIWKMAYYDDMTAAFQAVASGAADCLLMNSYRISRMSDQFTRYKLSTLGTGETMNLAFAVGRENDCLYSILNKIIRLIPDSTINASLTNYSFSDEKVTFGKYLKDNLPSVVAALAIVSTVILLLALWSLRAERKASEGRQIISEAERDQLTQLYNRNFFFVYANRLFRYHREKQMDAVIVNIERFHSLNTLNGRDFGDKALKSLGGEISRFLEETEGIASRVEADHFYIYCVHQQDHQALLDRFQDGMKNAIRNTDIRLRMGVMPWQEGVTPEHMFDQAWTACSLVRGNYKTHLMVYDEQLRQRDRYTQQLLNDIRRALEEHELEVYYQPKYFIQSSTPRLSSAEALVRWRHPQLGLIMPGDFIPLFERNGYISAVDKYIWAEAARQIAAWRDQYGVTLPVSVNISRVDVFDPTLPDTLDSLVAQYGLDRKDLNLEVTESAYTEDADHLLQIIRLLREKGYIIEMDDFGSGYSSLNMLSAMPIDILKMDIEFIRNIEGSQRDLRLVEQVIEIAKSLEVPVIAEGVENEKQLDLLRKAGCDLVQGFYFSHPLTAENFEELIAKEMKKDR